MAIYHLSVKNISRSKGQSAVASAAYRSGDKLHDEEIGKDFDYTAKDNIVYSEINLPKNAPEEFLNRETLWNSVESIEKASNARLAREFELALPNELTLEESKELAREFSKSLAEEGMVSDWSIHWNDGNHHIHDMTTTRPIKENGEWGQKEKKAYALDENGEKIPIIDSKTGEQKVDSHNRKQWQRETVEANDWNKKEKLEEWRERWEEQCNRAIDRHNERTNENVEHVDRRSHAERGLEQQPTIHEGWQARQMEARGEISERCQYNREVKEYNNLLQKFAEKAKEIMKLTNEKVRDAIERTRERLSGVGRTGHVERGAASTIGVDDRREQSVEKATGRDSGTTEFLRNLRTAESSAREERKDSDARAKAAAESRVNIQARTNDRRTRTEELRERAESSAKLRADREAERERLRAEKERAVEERSRQGYDRGGR